MIRQASCAQRVSRTFKSLSLRTISASASSLYAYRAAAGTAGSIEAGSMKAVECKGADGTIEVLFVRTKTGKLFGVEPKCPHYGAPLVSGVVADGTPTYGVKPSASVICPWHLAEFDLESGASLGGLALRGLQTYSVNEAPDGSIKVQPKPSNADEAKPLPGASQFLLRGGLQDIDGESVAAGLLSKVVVVGAGAAGMAAVQEMRETGYRGQIVVVSQERHLPYDRTKLSKGVMPASDEDMAALTLYDSEWFEEHRVTLLLNTTATDCDMHEHSFMQGGTLKLSSSSSSSSSSAPTEGSLEFEHAVFATGCIPNRLPQSLVPPERGAAVLRSADDAMAIRKSLDSEDTRKVVIVGTSFIGMEMAKAVSERLGKPGPEGLDALTVVGMEDGVFANLLPPPAREPIEKAAREAGVKFHFNASVEGTTGGEDGRVQSVQVKEGENGPIVDVPCDFLILAVGGQPATEALVDALAHTRCGMDSRILVDIDSRCVPTTAADASIFVAGDIVSAPRRQGGRRDHIEHWGHAQAEGRWVGRQVVSAASGKDWGIVERNESIPFFWTAGFGGNVRMAGHANETAERTMSTDSEPGSGSFGVFYHRNGEIHAMATLGKDPAPSAFAALAKVRKLPGAEAFKGEEEGGGGGGGGKGLATTDIVEALKRA